MSDIFLSYAHEDLERVLPLVEALERHGWSVWWDRTIPLGRRYAQVIQEALEAARCVIVVWSEALVGSPWVETEVGEGNEHGILVPALIDDGVSIPLEFRRIQAAQLAHWRGAETDPEFERMVQAVTGLIGPPQPRESVSVTPDEAQGPDESELQEAHREEASPQDVMTDESRPELPKDMEADDRQTSVPEQDAVKQLSDVSTTARGKRLAWGVGIGVCLVVALVVLVFYKPPLEEATFQNAIGMEFVRIPAGTFRMGSTDGEADNDEQPVHTVRISRPFYLGKYEVTQGQWKAVMHKNPSPSHFEGSDELPVESVSWEDVQAFITQLNDNKEGYTYRLPTEAEWEYAARAETKTAYSFGDESSRLDEYAWYSGNAEGKTHPVGKRKPNPWDLHDMHGNVWEWVRDRYGEYTAGSTADPTGPSSGTHRVYRGGSWDSYARGCRSAHRYYWHPGSRYHSLGFRVLRIIE